MREVKLAGVSLIALAATAVCLAAPVAAAEDSRLNTGSLFDQKYTAKGSYMSGDFHNHTTCSDGSTSVQTLTKKSLTYLDWFVQSDHGGSGERDCSFDDFAPGQRKLWSETVGVDAIKGDPKAPNNGMWRWQSLQEYQFDIIVKERIKAGKPAFAGMEWVVPSHEHTSSSVIAGQFDRKDPNAAALAHFEYCFGVGSEDTSQGGGQGWTCEVNAKNNAKLVKRFGSDPNQGPADYNSTLSTRGINTNDTGDHVKSTAAVYWMQQNYPGQSYAVPAHLERAGAFVPGQNRGYNIEHLRDWNNASPDVAFGFESQPGHQASDNRGEYSAGRSPNGSAGQFTFGGTGCYAAAESAKPGLDFDGKPLTQADFAASGRFADIPDTANPAGVTLCRPGIRTVWDAMLSEGRRYFFFASSDWHSRGTFAPFETASTNDFWPGEYQKTHTWIRKGNDRTPNPAKDIVDGLRSGNAFATTGDLIDDIEFKACSGRDCATMGETLKVRKGSDVTVTIKVHDPKGANNSPYSFNNPALLQIGVKQPLNKPELAQVDLIQGDVHDMYDPIEDAEQYRNPLAPATTKIAKSWTAGGKGGHDDRDDRDDRNDKGGHGDDHGGKDGWTSQGEWKSMTYVLRNVGGDKYVRARGTNLPAGTPNKRDLNGNPLSDKLSNNIACADPACPAHVNGIFDKDVEGWGDLSFHANPIFIEVEGYQRPRWVKWWLEWLRNRG